MRLQSVRTAIAASAAAAVLAACGHGIVPQSVAGGSSNTFQLASCYTHAVQPAWIFMGNCGITTKLPSGPGFKDGLERYHGVQVDIRLPKTNATGKSFVLVDATGNKDIQAYRGKAFPLITGKSLIYVEIVNAQAGLTLESGDLKITVNSSSALPGKSCPLSILQQKGKKFSWLTTFFGSVKGSTITFRGSSVGISYLFPTGLPAGPIFFNVSCS